MRPFPLARSTLPPTYLSTVLTLSYRAVPISIFLKVWSDRNFFYTLLSVTSVLTFSTPMVFLIVNRYLL